MKERNNEQKKSKIIIYIVLQEWKMYKNKEIK